MLALAVEVEALGPEAWQTAGSAAQPEHPFQAVHQETQTLVEPKQAAQGLLVLFVEAGAV